MGFIVGTSVSYIGNSSWVFEKKPTARNVVTFWIVTLFGLAREPHPCLLLERLAFHPFSTTHHICHCADPQLHWASLLDVSGTRDSGGRP